MCSSDLARRMEAWWNRAILDRPCIQVTAPRPDPVPIPQKDHSSLRERWLDAEYAVDCAQAYIANTYYGGEILPAYFPNLGPELLTATLGAELEFTRETSWSIPILHNWDDVPSLRVDPENLYTRTLLEMTRHEFLDPSRRRQRTTFADGTRVTVDFDRDTWDVEPPL